MEDKNISISQKELFKQYLASRNKLKKISGDDVIKKLEERHEKINKRLNERYKNDEEYKKKRQEDSRRRYQEKYKPKREQAKQEALKQQQSQQEDNNKIIEEEPISEPQEEKRQSKKMNEIHNLFNRHLFV